MIPDDIDIFACQRTDTVYNVSFAVPGSQFAHLFNRIHNARAGFMKDHHNGCNTWIRIQFSFNLRHIGELTPFIHEGIGFDFMDLEKFVQTAFQLVPGEVSEIQELSDGYYLLQVAETRPARIPELSAVESAVTKDLIKETQKEMARKDAEALLAEVKNGVSLEQAAKKSGLARRTSDFIKRSDPVGDIGNEPEISRVAFDLSERQPLAADPVQTAKGYCVLRFVEQKEPAMEGFEKERAQIKERLLQQKQLKAWEVWMSQLHNSSQIERKKDFS